MPSVTIKGTASITPLLTNFRSPSGKFGLLEWNRRNDCEKNLPR